jgi:hypothetical protein
MYISNTCGVCEASSTEKVAVSVMHLISPVTSGTVFFKLSKLLHQEDALSVPCFRGDSALRRRPRGAWE